MPHLVFSDGGAKPRSSSRPGSLRWVLTALGYGAVAIFALLWLTLPLLVLVMVLVVIF